MYESKAKVVSIKATSRVALKIRDNYFTIEYAEERTVPDVEGVDIEQERKILFDDVNTVVDDQQQEIYNLFKK